MGVKAGKDVEVDESMVGFCTFRAPPDNRVLGTPLGGVSRTCSTVTVPPTETSNQKHTPNMAIRSVMQA